MCDQRNIRDRIEAFENRIVELEKENARLNAQTVEFNHCPFCDATITLIESNDKKRIAELEKGNAELLARMLVQAREAAETETQLRAEIEVSKPAKEFLAVIGVHEIAEVTK